MIKIIFKMLRHLKKQNTEWKFIGLTKCVKLTVVFISQCNVSADECIEQRGFLKQQDLD